MLACPLHVLTKLVLACSHLRSVCSVCEDAEILTVLPIAADVTEGVTAHFVDQYEQVYDLAFNYDEEAVEARDADSGEEVLLADAAPVSQPQAVPQQQAAQAWAARPEPWAYRQQRRGYKFCAASHY